MRSCCAGRCGPHEHDSGTPVTTRRLLALNVGSSTLKGASYLFNTEGHCAQPRLLERSRAEIPVGVDAQERLATLLETLSSSEERRVGKEWFRTFRSRWSPYL